MRREKKPKPPPSHPPLMPEEREQIERELGELDLRIAAGALGGVVADALRLEMRALEGAACVRPRWPPTPDADCAACAERRRLADDVRLRRFRARLAAPLPYTGARMVPSGLPEA